MWRQKPLCEDFMPKKGNIPWNKLPPGERAKSDLMPDGTRARNLKLTYK